MSRIFDRAFAGLGALALAMAIITIATAQTAEPHQPVLTGSYGWEDGEATIFGSNAPNNITAVNVDNFVKSGERALRVTESPHSGGAVHLYLGHIRNLEDGDIIRASFWTYDDIPGSQKRVRIWAHYTIGESANPVAQAGGNSAYSQGIGWEELSNEWTFNAFAGNCNGNCDGLVIQARLYSAPNNCQDCSTDYWFDDLAVKVYCATDPNLTINFPDGTTIGDPMTPHELCEPADAPSPCSDPDVTADYGWEDGQATILGGQSIANVIVENVTDFVRSGTHALMATEDGHTGGARILYIAHVKNLTHGDVVNAGFWTYDDTPEPGTEEDPAGSVRIWARYTSGDGIGNPSAFPPGSNNMTHTSGIGWEEMSHSWVFDSALGDGIVIEARLYGSPANCPACSMDYWIDDLWVNVCSSNPQDLVIDLPPDADTGDPDPPVDPCTDPDIAGNYAWEDGEGTIVGTSHASFITAVNSDELVHSGSYALKVTESPHHPSQNPQVWLAHIRNLQDGNRITVSFWTNDDTPNGYPSVRIWGHYTSGSSRAAVAQAGGNLAFSSGIGWEELSHTWEFDSLSGVRDGLVIQARLYSPACPDGDVCSSDYFIDTLAVNVCAANPQNIMILFPDSFIHDDEPPEVCDDPMIGFYGWEDGEGTYINASSSKISGTNITADDGPVLDEHGLRITESPNASSNPDVRLAFIEKLEHGDVIRASFWTYDDTPGEHPRVRIWARRGFSGEPYFLGGSAGGSSDWSSPGGWVKREHVWEFDEGSGQNPYDALMVMARVFAPTCDEDHPGYDPDTGECATHYFVDDLVVEVCSEHPNVTITLPDGTVIGDPGEPQDCIADVDGSGTIDIFDLFAVLGAWGTADPYADVNGDGLVDGADLGIVLASFGPCSEFLFPMPGSAELLLEDTDGPGGLRQYDLFVELKSGQSLVNVYDGDVNSSRGFEGGSFITIGVDFEHPDVAEDPNFDFSEFNNGTSLGVNAGWYNFDPSNDLGLADLYPDYRVLIARFFIDPASQFDAELSVTYEDADGRARQATVALAPDDTPCPGDITGNGSVGVPDLLALLACWGPVEPGAGCEVADLTGSGSVGVTDLLDLLSQWGPCPE